MFFKRMGSRPASISDAVYAELVETLHSTLAPAATSAAGQALAGTVIVWQTGDVLVTGLLTVAGVLLNALRALNLVAFRRRAAARAIGPDVVRRYGQRHHVASMLAAIIVGLIIARSLVFDDTASAIVAMGVGFAFGDGVIARLSLLPMVACAALVALGLPAMIACLWRADVPHLIIAALVLVYFADSFEMVRRTFNSTLTHILLKQKFERSARTDPLTGLLNRAALTTDLPDMIGASNGMVTVYAIDLDHFKAANDRFGHPVGDALLKQVAGRLNMVSSPGSLIIRMGGDEFILVDTAMRTRDGAAALADHILTSVSAPYQVGAHAIVIGVSIGVAMAPDHGPSADILLSRADKALYQAKVGRGGYAFADEVLLGADAFDVHIVAHAPELVPSAA